MAEKPQAGPRSGAAREASRRNGARSRGPTSEAGKRRSSQNARQHGLRAQPAAILAKLPSWLAPLEQALLEQAGSSDEAREVIDRILVAEFNRHQANALLSTLLVELSHPEGLDLAASLFGAGQFAANIVELGYPKSIARLIYQDTQRRRPRIQRYLAYEKRFRGQRDRGLKALAPLIERHRNGTEAAELVPDPV